MKVHIELESWEYKQTETGNKIQGYFFVKAGAVQVAKQSFNHDYQTIKVNFSAALMVKVEELNKLIIKEIQETFLGKGEQG